MDVSVMLFLIIFKISSFVLKEERKSHRFTLLSCKHSLIMQEKQSDRLPQLNQPLFLSFCSFSASADFVLLNVLDGNSVCFWGFFLKLFLQYSNFAHK